MWGIIFPDCTATHLSHTYFRFRQQKNRIIFCNWYQFMPAKLYYKRRIFYIIAQYYCNKFCLNAKITHRYDGRSHLWARWSRDHFILGPKMATRRNMRHNYFSHDATAFISRNLYSAERIWKKKKKKSFQARPGIELPIICKIENCFRSSDTVWSFRLMTVVRPAALLKSWNGTACVSL